eukprot:GEMP01066033.1.p1 GENE.GEMP01066033.1~~GEMP01066033.1.p1  ORF type:complete len:196 (-),score=34.54 GEMP01066033.1:729-1283(-)
MSIAYGYSTSGGDVVIPGAEALGLADIAVGERTYVFQGSFSDIRKFLKSSPQKKIIGKSCDTDTGKWVEGKETIKIKIYDVSTAPQTGGQCVVEVLQKGAVSAAGNVCDAVDVFNTALDALGVGENTSNRFGDAISKIMGKKITIELDTYVKAESKGRGAYRVIDTNSTALTYLTLKKILKATV